MTAAPGPDEGRVARHRITLGPEHDGVRIDRALVAALAEAGAPVSRSRLARSFAAGQVCVGGRPVAPSARVTGPWEVEVLIPARPPLSADPEPMDLRVVYEDEAVLVVDKPAGVLVHPAGGVRHGTLVSGVLAHLARRPPPLGGNGPDRPGVVHRIDRDTSGLLVFAKTEAAALALAEQFRAHTVERRYLAVGHGRAGFDVRGVCTRHGRDPADRRRFSPRAGPRTARSVFSVLARSDRATAFAVELSTGRTHQVRMHARHLGHPLVGDPLYGPRRKDDLDRRMGRQALHAQVLGFRGPDGVARRFVAPLPRDLRDLVEHLFGPGAAASIEAAGGEPRGPS